jgi:hypothetical protein
MEFNISAKVLVDEKQPDGYGGYSSQRVVAGEIKVKVAPYRVAMGEMIAVPNPISSVKFFTNSQLPVSEERIFYIEYNNKIYKKVAYIDYGKCSMVIGELYEN